MRWLRRIHWPALGVVGTPTFWIPMGGRAVRTPGADGATARRTPTAATAIHSSPVESSLGMRWLPFLPLLPQRAQVARCSSDASYVQGPQRQGNAGRGSTGACPAARIPPARDKVHIGADQLA